LSANERTPGSRGPITGSIDPTYMLMKANADQVAAVLEQALGRLHRERWRLEHTGDSAERSPVCHLG
jgi:hypothetical protein